MSRKLVTREAAGRIGIAHNTLLVYLSRYPEVRPAEKLPNNQGYLWTFEEVQRVIEHRRKRGIRLTTK